MSDTHKPDAEETIAFGALPDLAGEAQLPTDASSKAFAAAIRALRPAFERREDYNSFICTQLAARGVTPNTSNVLDIGGWGSKRDVVQDVKSWFAQVARRAADTQFAVPPGMRRPALQLLEEMWALACRQATEHIERDRQQALGAFESQRQALLEAQQSLQDSEAALHSMTAQRDEALRLSEELRRQLDSLHERHRELTLKASSEIESARNELERERATQRESVQRMQEAHSQALRDAVQRSDAQLNEAARRHAQDAAQLQARLQSMEQALERARQEARMASEQLAQHSRAMAVEVDKARREALAAAERALQAQQRITDINARLVEADLRAAALERDLARERETSAAALASLRDEMARLASDRPRSAPVEDVPPARSK